MRELTGFQRDLLVVIGSLEEPSGLDVKRELEDSQGISQLSSRVYSNLDDLVSAGLVEKGRSDGRTNSYLLTAGGVETVRRLYRWREAHLPVEEVLAGDRGLRDEEPRRVASRQSG